MRQRCTHRTVATPRQHKGVYVNKQESVGLPETACAPGCEVSSRRAELLLAARTHQLARLPALLDVQGRRNDESFTFSPDGATSYRGSDRHTRAGANEDMRVFGRKGVVDEF